MSDKLPSVEEVVEALGAIHAPPPARDIIAAAISHLERMGMLKAALDEYVKWDSISSATLADVYRVAIPANPDNEPVLCYVQDNVAYFTTRALDEQWGDDWDDAPYEHNAGRPYLPLMNWRDKDGVVRDANPDGSPKWKIVEINFSGPFETPCEHKINSPYSVQDINRGDVPWLRTADDSVVIPAGTPLSDFIDAIKAGGGTAALAVKEGDAK